MDEGHALLFIGAWRTMHIGLAPEENPAFIGRVDSGQTLDKGGLACAILAEQRQHFTCIQMQVYITQGCGSAEALGDVFKCEQALSQPFLPCRRPSRVSLECYR